MTAIRAVHECLFCPQVFESAAAKDDHVLEHFAQETCTDCNQNLIRIGGHLYIRHNAVTCIKSELKFEELMESWVTDQPVVQHFIENRKNVENQYEKEIETDKEIKIEPLAYDDEDEDLQPDTDYLAEILCGELKIESTSSEFQEEEEVNMYLGNSSQHQHQSYAQIQNYLEEQNDDEMRMEAHAIASQEQLMTSEYSEEVFDFLSEEFKNVPYSGGLQKHFSGSLTTIQTEEPFSLPDTEYLNQNPVCVDELQIKTEPTEPTNVEVTPANKIEPNAMLGVLREHSYSTLIKSKRKGRRSQCNICGKYLSCELSVQRHKILIHMPFGVIHCDICSKIFSTVQERDSHWPQCILKST